MYDKNLFESNVNLVYYIVNKYFYNFRGDDDVIQSGLIGLWKACKSYDPDKSKFATYASKCILNQIRLYFRHESKYTNNVSVSLDENITISNDGDEVCRYDLLEDLVAIYCMDDFELTHKETQVLHLKSKGYTDLEISKKLNLSQPYVSRIKNSAYKKIKKSVINLN